MIALVPTTPAVAPSMDTDTGSQYARMDLSEAAKTEFAVSVPPGAGFELVLDHATGKLAAEPAMTAPTALPGIVAGCVNDQASPTLNWANDPPKVRPLMGCPYQALGGGIERSTLVCIGQGSCYMDGLGFGPAGFGYFFVYCPRPTITSLSWTGNPSGSLATCSMFVFGANPNTWAQWDSICDGFGVGYSACLHLFRI